MTTEQFGYQTAINQIRWIRRTFKVGESMGGVPRRELLASWCNRARQWKYGFCHARTLARK